MKIKKIKIFELSELSEEAKKTAIESLRGTIEYFYGDDNRKSLQEFENIFPIKVKNWSYGGDRSDGISFNMECEDHISELSGFRLAKYIWNNYGHRIYKGKYYSSRMISTGRKTPPMFNYKYIHSKCTLEAGANLTGYSADLYLLDTIFDFLDKPDSRTFEDLMSESLNQWIKQCTEDVESTYTDEYIEDHAEANEYEFLETGERF